MAHPSSNPGGDSAFRTSARNPEDLERFAALLVPSWELPADVSADAPDPGSASSSADAWSLVRRAGAMSPGARTKPASTMMNIAGPDAALGVRSAEPTARAATPLPAALNASLAASATPAPRAAAGAHPRALHASHALEAPEEGFRKRRSPLLFVLLAGGALAAAAVAFFSLRGAEPPTTPADKESVTAPEKGDLPLRAPLPARQGDPHPAMTARENDDRRVRPDDPSKAPSKGTEANPPSDPAGARQTERPAPKPEKPAAKPVEARPQPAPRLPAPPPAAPKAVAPPHPPKAAPPAAKKPAPKIKDEF